MIKNEKVFELRIEEDDDLSGIDSISLVSEPAIEVNWIAFNKEKQEDFHIPDGEDDKYVEMLMSKGQLEEDLLNDGYVIHSVEVVGKDAFATNPNAVSEWDEEDVLVRYKYMLRPNINESSVISTTRDFCRNLVNKNYVWRVEEMDSLVNDFGSPAIVWRGGYNCRHVWAKIQYKKDATIINKASVNKGKVTVGDFPTDMNPDLSILGYPQPSTITEKTRNNPSPSTIKNLGLSKENFYGSRISLDFDDTLSTQRGQDLARNLINRGYDVYVVTSRQKFASSGVYYITDKLGIPRDKVIFTEGRLKWRKLKELGISKHYDNNEDEVKAIRDNAPLIQAIKFEVGVAHYTEDGKLYEGPTHKDADGRLMTGAVHTKDSVYLYHEGELPKSSFGYDVGEIGGYVDPGVTGDTVTCKECGWEWEMKDGGEDVYVCHKCGYDNSIISKSLTPPSMFASYSDYPDSVKNNAKAVLKYAEENGWGDCGTEVGKQRANQLANGEPISDDTIKRMYSYLSRHAVDLDSSKGYDDGCGKLMYDAWGGKSALSWAEAKIKAIDKEKMSKQEFAQDEEKRIVIGPAMIPDMHIFRKDAAGNPYHVYFSTETIKMIAEKYMRNKYIDNNDTEHNGKAAADVYVIESWIKEDAQDKSNKYGFESLPIGTWFVSMKVRNPEVWQDIKDKKLNGFSVSGYFEEVAQFCMEEMFLKQVIEILNNVND